MTAAAATFIDHIPYAKSYLCILSQPSHLIFMKLVVGILDPILQLRT
jgi:hypothetical protein